MPLDAAFAPVDIPELRPEEFEAIRKFARERFGLDLRDGKQKLVSARLAKYMRAGGFRSFREYCRHVIDDRSGAAEDAMADSLTTHHTSFLRESDHFEHLRKDVLPGLLDRREIRIWCAASSTGEEPYSIACSLLEEFETLGIRPGMAPQIRILATDISTKVLATASNGMYPRDRLTKIPERWSAKYFLRGHGQWDGWCKVKPEVARCVRFERLNLMDSFGAHDPWPVVFCRNVMIYFDRETQADVVRRMSASLDSGGYLFIGHAESLASATEELAYVKPAMYRKPHAPGRGAR